MTSWYSPTKKIRGGPPSPGTGYIFNTDSINNSKLKSTGQKCDAHAAAVLPTQVHKNRVLIANRTHGLSEPVPGRDNLVLTPENCFNMLRLLTDQSSFKRA